MVLGLERIKTRFGCNIPDTLISQIYTFLLNETLSPNASDYIEKSVEAEILNEYIVTNNLFFDELKFSIYLDDGAEQTVFFND